MPGFAAVAPRMAQRPSSRSTSFNPITSSQRPVINVPNYTEKEFRKIVYNSAQKIYNDMAIIDPVLGRELYKIDKGRNYLVANCFKKIDNPTDGVFKSPCVKSVDCLMNVTLDKKRIITREYGGVTLQDDSLTIMNKRRYEIEKEIDNKQDINTLAKKLAMLEKDKKLNCFPTEFWQPFSTEEIESKQRVANDIFNRGQYKPLVLKGSLSTDKRYYRFCPKSFNGVAELKYVKTKSSNELYFDDENTPYYHFIQSYRETDKGDVIEQTIVLPELTTIMARSAITSYFTGKSATVRGGRKRTKRKRRSPK